MTKPALYAMLLPELRDAAMIQGYVLALHGSLVTSLEVVAVPWEPTAVEPQRLIDALRKVVAGKIINTSQDLPHGRKLWRIGLLGTVGQYSIDVSVLPGGAPAPKVAAIRQAAAVRAQAGKAAPALKASPAPVALPGLTMNDLHEGTELVYRTHPTVVRFVGKILRAYSPPKFLVVKGNEKTGRRLSLENLNKEFRLPD
jgi:hypothetical protein